MRYKIDKKLIKIIHKNRKIFNGQKFKHRYKNWLYRNKSMSKNQLKSLCKFLKINPKHLNIKPFYSDRYRAPYKEIKFKGADTRFAELIGILLGDGNLDKSQNQINIVIDSREGQYINFVSNLFYQIFEDKLKKYKFPNKNSIRLYFYGKKLMDILVKHGLKRGNKIKNNVGIPQWIKKDGTYCKYCIRGLMDTDGCVFYHKRDNAVYLNYSSSSKKLSSDFLHCTRKIGFNFIYYGKQKKNIGLFRKKEVKEFVEKVGFSNEKHLKRYYNFINISKGL